MKAFPFGVALALVAASPALAETADCQSMPSLDKTDFATARVLPGAPRVHFRNTPDCSDAAPGCLRKGYLVPGNELIVTGRAGDLTCAVFVAKNGAEYWGWLPNSALAIEQVATLPPNAWAGRWTRIESSIVISAMSGGQLSIKGDATYGARDPDRVRRGGVNIGNIEGIMKPNGNKLSFAMGDDGEHTVTRPFSTAAQYDCAVQMQRVGRWLLVEDNSNCGGMNVRFNGIYERSSRK